MEFLKIISDDSSIEIIPLNKIFSIKVIMGKLYINGESKYLKVENSEKFLDTYIKLTAAINIVIHYAEEPEKVKAHQRYICIKNVDGYAKISVETINIE